MKGPYISRVQITNFRNFRSVDVELAHKQVIIGENNVGKTNFLRALQLILDPGLSDNDRRLDKSDFHDGLEDPMHSGAIIEIAIEIRGYENIQQIRAKMVDAVISDNPPTLRITYRFEPIKDENEVITGHDFILFKGENKDNRFTHQDRSLLNLKVIKALRDVERELKGLKRSPVFQLVNQYEIPNDELKQISEELKEASEKVMELDEIKVVTDLIVNKYQVLSGRQFDNELSLSTFDIDPERLLHTLQVLMGEKRRPVSKISLGLCNILYITLMLLLIRDRTIPEVLRPDKMDRLKPYDSSNLLEQFYEAAENGTWNLKENFEQHENYQQLYALLNRHYMSGQGFTILAVEEPEAHLHPVLQRLLYGEVLQRSETSVIFSTHSTHITSIAPVNSVVHLRRDANEETHVTSSAKLELDEKDRHDLERYLDARRGEIYFGAGVILVEGIAEEYLIPRFAELLGLPLDRHQIVVCNVNCAHFAPYVKLLNALEIPWCLITDGDYYELEIEKEMGKDGKEKEKKTKHFHRMMKDGVKKYFKGLGVACSTLKAIGIERAKDAPESKWDFNKTHGCFVGTYTLEVDLMEKGGAEEDEIIKTVYSEIRPGGEQQQKNFDDALDAKDYWEALKKIETNAGKGRFAQRLTAHFTAAQIPAYVEEAIRYIIQKSGRENE
jgi:putative ATP-dependent endonuclease of OLD family